MSYVSPGAAFSSSLEDTMLARVATQRQAVLDQRAAVKANDEHEEAMNALQEKRAEATQRLEDKEKAQITREVTDMVPGDIPDASLIARARKYHIPLPTTTTTPESEPAPVVPVPKIIQTLGGVTPPVAPMPAQAPAPIRFAGSPVDRRKAIEDKKQEDYIKTLPADSAERKALEYEQMTGKPAPAGMFQRPTHSAIYNEWQDAVSNGYKKDFVTYQNEDANRKEKATGAGAAASSARENTRRDNNYKSAVTELEAAAKPVVAQMQSIDDLGTMINERTPQADALIAPMVLKATISGTGSGFRMTQAEINQVLGAGSKWQSLERALNKWQTDPSKALSVTDEQRDQLRSLAKAIRRKAHEKVIKLTKARHDLDDADGVDAIHRTMTSLKDDLYGSETAEEPAKPKTAADYIKQYSTAGAKK